MAPRVVCIHFSTGSDAQWRALTDGLSGRCRMLGVDLHGRAHAWPTFALSSLQVDAHAVAHAVRTVKHGAVHQGLHLVGYSYGATVALKALFGATWDASLLAALRMAVLLMQGSQTRPSAARVA